MALFHAYLHFFQMAVDGRHFRIFFRGEFIPIEKIALECAFLRQKIAKKALIDNHFKKIVCVR